MRRFLSLRVFCGVIFIALLLLAGCGTQNKAMPAATTQSRSVMGTVVQLTIYDKGLSSENLEGAIKDVFSELEKWEKCASNHGPENQILKISEGAGVQSVTVDDDVFELITKALKYYDQSGKIFDIRYGPMLDLWNFDKTPRVPTSAELDTAKTLVSNGGMFVAGHSILLAKKGMRFDVREFVIGFAFDKAMEKLAQRGIHSAMLASDRVCRTLGESPDKRGFPWTLKNPLNAGAAWQTVWAPTGGLAYVTSTVNAFQANGKKYHSILDPRTGLPANKCAGTIVQSADAASAQALAYATYVLGGTDGLDAAGKAAISGFVVVSGEEASLKISANGSLAQHLEAAK